MADDDEKVLGLLDRKARRKLLRKKEKRLLKLRGRIDQQLAANGVGGRVQAIANALGDPEVGEAIDAARRLHEATVGPIKDYNVLRSVVETKLSMLGFDVRDVMLKFTWDPAKKELGIGVFASPRAVKAAAEDLGVDTEDAFQAMLEAPAPPRTVH